MPNPAHVREPKVNPDDLPLEEGIRQRAHELALQRGSQSGFEMDDWLQAQDEIRTVKEHRKGRA